MKKKIPMKMCFKKKDWSYQSSNRQHFVLFQWIIDCGNTSQQKPDVYNLLPRTRRLVRKDKPPSPRGLLIRSHNQIKSTQVSLIIRHRTIGLSPELSDSLRNDQNMYAIRRPLICLLCSD